MEEQTAPACADLLDKTLATNEFPCRCGEEATIHREGICGQHMAASDETTESSAAPR